MRFLRRLLSGGSPEPPADELTAELTDIDAWGGSWQAIVGLLHEEPFQVRAACDFIESGTVPPTAHVPGSNAHAPSSKLFLETLGPTQGSGRVVAALLMALPGATTRGNALALYVFKNCNRTTATPTLYMFVTGRLRDSNAPLRHRELAALGEVLGWPPTEILDQFFATGRGGVMTGREFLGIPDIDEFLWTNRETIRARLRPARAEHEQFWERLIDIGTDEIHRYLRAEMFDAATADSRKLRKVVVPLFDRLPVADRITGLTNTLQSAEPPQRGRIIQTAAELPAGSERNAFLTTLQSDLSDDRSGLVAETLAELNVSHAANLPLVIPKPDPPTIPRSAFPPDLCTHRDGGHSFDWANGRGPLNPMAHRLLAAAIRENHPILALLTPHHVARLLFRPYRRGGIAQVLVLLRERHMRPSPLDVTSVLMVDGIDERRAIDFCCSIASAEPSFWTTEEVLEWARHHEGELITMLVDRSAAHRGDREGYFILLKQVAPRSDALQTALVDAAITGYEADRSTLYTLLGGGCVEQVIPYLSSRKRAERLGAAEALQEFAALVPTDTVRAIARKESDDLVLSALLAVLTAAGESIDEFVSVDALLRNATQAMEKKNAIPAALDLLPIDSLPSVAWADGSGLVDPVIMRWFLVSAVRAKTSEPSPIMAQHFDAMDGDDLRVFGSALLDMWLAEDTRVKTEEEIALEVAPMVEMRWAYVQSGEATYTMTFDELRERITARRRGELAGSATGSKGLLAVVAASAGPEVAAKAGSYIRKYRGNRKSQATSLLQMLAWIDEPATVQQLTAVAASFRPKGIQEAAMKEAELLAQRKGWSADDLADRCIPNAGFESDGRRVHDYGDRTFTAHLAGDLSVSLVDDENGKTIRSLPKARPNEDERAVAELRKGFSMAKKELKSVVAMQQARLHQAMCVQRSWSADDFRRCFVDHPVMVRLASRLVWAGTTGSGGTVGFRPLIDGSLLGVDNEPVSLSDDMVITITHGHVMSPDATDLCLAHLRSHEVDALFPQFDRTHVEVSEGQRTVDQFVGHVIDEGALRSQIDRFGWQMGQAMDGGLVGEVLKDLPSVELTAVLGLHGSFHASDSDTGAGQVALEELLFVPLRSSGWIDASKSVELSMVPPILLREVYAEVQAIAEAGDGFDPDYLTTVSLAYG